MRLREGDVDDFPHLPPFVYKLLRRESAIADRGFVLDLCKWDES